MIEAPRLLFPFARAIIPDCTRNGGFMPLNIQPVDFVAVYQHNMVQKSDAQTNN
jgi:preprotein translocase subunit SecB